MRLPIFIVAASLLLTGSAAGAQNKARVPQTAPAAQKKAAPAVDSAAIRRAFEVQLQDAIKKRILDDLNDPESARFTFDTSVVEVTYWQRTYLVCGTVNSKNRYGGYDGRKAFLGTVRDSAGQPLKVSYQLFDGLRNCPSR